MPEQLLWLRLSRRQLGGFKFRRQHGIGSFIVDFFCPSAGLIIEIDGDSHFSPQAVSRDEKRTWFFEQNGLRVLRFTNSDIMKNIEGVCGEILRALDTGNPS